MSTAARLLASIVVAASTALACADVGDGRGYDTRAAFVVDRLADDNSDLMGRSPVLAAGKLAAMAESPYAFFRGSLRLFAEDCTTPGSPCPATADGTADAAGMALIGDPHVENLGSYRAPDGTFLVDFNDFDAATYGPYWFDLRRLALSFALADDAILGPDSAPGTTAERRAEVATVAASYVDEILRLADGRGTPLDATRVRPLAALLGNAAADGLQRKELTDDTTLVGGARRLRTGAGSDAGADTLLPVSAAERTLAQQAFAQYPATALGAVQPTLEGLELQDVARRLGAGVASQASLRLYVVARPRGGLSAGDRLLEFKEVRDLPVPLWLGEPSRPFTDNATRVVTLQRALQIRPDADAFLGWAVEGRLSFRIRERTAYQKRLAVTSLAEDFAAGDLTTDDLRALAAFAGRRLADAHAHAPDIRGRPGLADVLGALAAAGDPDGRALIAETVNFAESYREVVRSDFQAFRRALQRSGPLLGHRFSPETL